MSDSLIYPERGMQWGIFLFMVVSAALAVIGMPLYIFSHGISRFDLLLFFFYVAATGLSVTMGYHRLFAHVSYKVPSFVKFLFLFFGAGAFEQSALKWASQHRSHHLYPDTKRDPYSMKQGFWHAHIGWLIFWKQPKVYENVKDLQKNKIIMNQHQYYGVWALVSGILVPWTLGIMAGHGWSTFFTAVCFRIFFVQQATFCINSLCHWIGKATYDPEVNAKDHGLVALVTLGEGYHSFHHRFPGDYRNGIRWYHWDPSKWLISLMGFFKMAKDLTRIPPERILRARLHAEKSLARKESRSASRPSPVLEQAFT
ncbi:MAG: fatty acid desaturase [Chlamydiae bacterium]|nr:fatty acid desaturase [Chlamydiota bacterium]MBI3266208.1 fatty acid desaturase [Chlamydiota bacterium]